MQNINDAFLGIEVLQWVRNEGSGVTFSTSCVLVRTQGVCDDSLKRNLLFNWVECAK
jgi:hypothetical protein